MPMFAPRRLRTRLIVLVLLAVPPAIGAIGGDAPWGRDLARAGAFGLAVLLGVWVAGEIRIVRDLKKVIDAARRFADGDLHARVPQPQTSEIGALAHAFNDMAAIVERRDKERAEAEAARLTLETRIDQSQRLEAVGQLAGGVAHDFNNLLTVIYACTDEALDRPDEAAEHLREIRSAADRAASLTRQLLAFSRKQVMQPQVLDVNERLGPVERMLRRLIGEDIELQTSYDSEVGRVMVDPNQLEQVILNLAVNARDAMPQGGILGLETRRVELTAPLTYQGFSIPQGTYVQLLVRDSGCGMTPEVQERIFEPFFSTKGSLGTGLGLATVYGIVKQSGGFIVVDSAPGAGTSFAVYFPVIDAAADAADGENVSRQLKAGDHTILVVEDEASVRSLIVTGLRRLGYTVLTAGHPQEALEIARSANALHLLLTDLLLPDMNGGMLADRMREIWPNVRVLFMSGYGDTDLVTRGILSPGASFVQKPFTGRALAASVASILQQPVIPPPAKSLAVTTVA